MLLHNLAAELPTCKTQLQDESCSIYKMATIFLLYVFQISFYVVKQYLEIYMFLYIQATQLSLQWMRNFSLDCTAAILSWRKAINKQLCLLGCKYLMVLFAIQMLNPGTTEFVNTLFYHNYLSIHNQQLQDVYIKDQKGVPALSCRCPMPTYIDCHVSLVFHICIICRQQVGIANQLYTE